MTKADIAEKIQESIGISRKDAAEMMEAVFAIMKEQLETGEPIKVSGFGTFTVNQKSARRGRNPHTGEEMTIGARKTLSFKPSNVLRDAINKEPA